MYIINLFSLMRKSKNSSIKIIKWYYVTTFHLTQCRYYLLVVEIEIWHKTCNLSSNMYKKGHVKCRGSIIY